MNFLRRLDPYLLIPAAGISGISLFLLTTGKNNLFLPQVIFIIIGLILYSVFSSLDYRAWPKFHYIFYVFSVLFLVLVLFTPTIRGAHRWIDFGYFVLQPSEILKPVIILFYAALFAGKNNIAGGNFLWPILSFLPILAMIFVQPDLGNVLIYMIFFVALLIIAGTGISFIIGGGFLAVFLLPAFWALLKDYQKSRIITFLNPNIDPSGAGYNAIQSMIAIGSGGLAGLGLGGGTQSRLYFLPEYQTDFIFATLVESLGLIGGSILIGLYIFMLIRILMICFNSEDDLGRFISAGIFFQIFAQIFINIGMNLGLLTITGITLPLLSYGGSSIVSTYMALGLVSAITSTLPKKLLVIR